MPGPDGRWGLGPTPGHRQEGFPGAGSSATLVTGGEGITEDDPTWSTHPLTPERFEDFADVTNPDRRATHCWCLSHRLRAKDIIEELGDGDRDQAMRGQPQHDRRPLPAPPQGIAHSAPRTPRITCFT